MNLTLFAVLIVYESCWSGEETGLFICIFIPGDWERAIESIVSPSTKPCS